MKVVDLASVVAPGVEQKEVGIRPGEKLHEQMIGMEDANSTYEYPGYFKILPVINGWDKDEFRINEGKKVASDFVYDSETNDSWMDSDQLKDWLNNNRSKMGTI